MWWPASRRADDRSLAAPLRRYVIAGIVAVIGIAVSFLIWIRALEERRLELANLLGSLADETTGSVEGQLERETNALRGLATFWQLHGLLEPAAWQTDVRMLLDHFTGIQWIAWVPRDSLRLRFVARDTTVRMDARVLNQAYFQLRAPSATVVDRWTDAYVMNAFFPARSRDTLGLLVAEIRVDTLWMRHKQLPNPSMSVALSSERGGRVVLMRNEASETPAWMILRRSLLTPAGTSVGIELTPSSDYARQLATPWPHYFLVSGLVLSLVLGALLFQFLRLRDFSTALEQTNRDLDAQLDELSRRDRELRDLNEALEQRVESRTQELTEALREVETFSHSVSHDLRSPIGAILNFADVLDEDYGPRMDEEGRRLLERVRAAGGRANQLLNALVEFAASGATAHQARPIDMKEVADGAFAEALAREERTDDVAFAVDQNLPPAHADPIQVHRIFVNLIGNALKYSRGQDRRALEVGGAMDGGGVNTYWVRDNGPGFEPGRAPEIFEPFRRLHGNRTEGTGLGLAIVAKVVRRSGGRAWAESDGATGATFYFTLPASERRTDEPAGRPARR